ncbi:MAG: hypothetical protein H6735_11870 [Alphaproteobacteria bacterium]|nr:hypothetical protein [Alphaproteobacteria bacterium]
MLLFSIASMSAAEPAATCFPVSTTIAKCLSNTVMTSGTSFYVEESSVCDGRGSGAIPDRCGDVLADTPVDAGVDQVGTLENLEAVDPELAGRLAGLADAPAHPLRVWTRDEIRRKLEDVARQVASQTGETPATIQSVEDGFLVVSSPEQLLRRSVDLDPSRCPTESGEWRRVDQQRCALAQFGQEGIGMLPMMVVGGVGGGLQPADGRVWHDTALWQVYRELFRGYSSVSGGFVLALQDVEGPGATGVRRSVRLEGLKMGQVDSEALAPIAIPPNP